MSEYRIAVESTDTHVAFDCEAQRARHEGFTGVADRQSATALHLRNAVHHMQSICPDGYRVKTEIVLSFVPAVNPVLKDEYRR